LRRDAALTPIPAVSQAQILQHPVPLTALEDMMNIVKPILIASALALGAGPAFAAKSSDDPGFNKLDRNNDGYLSRSEAIKNPYLRKNFKAADKDSDGKLSRTEYLEVMTRKDVSSLKDKFTGSKEKSAATGSSKPAK
jgi:hypothetical protein